MKLLSKLFVALACLACTATIPAATTSVSLVQTLPPGASLFSETVGYKFKVGSKALNVTSLGIVRGYTSFITRKQVGVWNEAGELIASGNPSAFNTTLEGNIYDGIYWQNLDAPVVLNPNTSYTIAACGTANFLEQWFNGPLKLSSDVSLVGFVSNNQQWVFSFPSSAAIAGQGAVGATLKYTLQNEILDTTAPIISIVAPATDAPVTAASATFSGSIVETGSMPALEYRLGDGSWTSGSLTGTASPYSWSQNVTLLAGTNGFQVRATDAAGNVSDVVSRSVTYTEPPLDSDGDGVTDYRERLDGTDPLDATSFNPLSKGLVAYYPFNGNANDESGNGYDGTVTTATLATDRFGREDKAFEFDGINDFIDLGDRSAFNFGSSNFSISVWLRSSVPRYGAYVLGKYSDNAPNSYGIGTDESGNSYAFASYAFAEYFDARGPKSLGDTFWHNVVAVYDLKSRLDVYRDGVLETSADFSGQDVTIGNNFPLLIGKIASGQNFEGSIDDVRIYNRALSPDEVALLYRTEAPVTDTTAPVLTLDSPAPGARFTAASATFSGSIAEAGGTPTLEYRLGNGAWTTGSLTGTASPYSWSQNVTLLAGSNSFQFRAKDAAGNLSDVVATSVTFVVPTTLTIAIPKATDGKISVGFGGNTAREIGAAYSVTATPASGMLFQKWLKGGTQVSTSATLNFTMEANMGLTPVFVPNFSALAGYYNGLVGTGSIGSGSAADMQSFPNTNGFIQFATTREGALTGMLRLEGKGYPFTGKILANKTASITIPRPGKTNAVATLNLVSALPGELSGTVNTGGTPLPFRALRGAYSTTSSHALAGQTYTLLVPAPEGTTMGHGYAKLVFDADGAAVLSGELPSATSVVALARIVDDGKGNWVFPVYAGSNSLLTGELILPKQPKPGTSELSGSLEWLRPAQPTAALYPAGFLKKLTPVGARLSITGTSPLLGGDTNSTGFTLTLDPTRSLLPNPLSQKGTWPLTNKPSLTLPIPNGLTLRFNPLSGGFEGSFNRILNGEPDQPIFRGAVFSQPLIPGAGRPAVRGAGFLKTDTATAPVEITTP